MYLLVFVTMVIGMISIYTQVLAVQTARLAASQVSIAQTMLAWHTAAVSMAASLIDVGTAPLGTPYHRTATGCNLTSPSVTVPPPCPAPNNSTSLNGTILNAASTPNMIYNNSLSAAANPEPVHLPPGYNTTNYRFYSVLYQDTTYGQDYVITFIPPPTISATNPAPGYISLTPPSPGGTTLGITMSDLMQQLRTTKLTSYSFGYVDSTATKLITSFIDNNSNEISYPIPTGLVANSIAIISSPDDM